MSPSLAVLVFSLLAVSPPSNAAEPAAAGGGGLHSTAERGRGPSDSRPAARAKQGLLPRKVRPSQVTYLDGAARRRGEVREFPGAPNADDRAPAVVVASDPRREGESASDARRTPEATGAPIAPASRKERVASVAPDEVWAEDAPVEDASTDDASTDEQAPAAEVATDTTAEEAADRARDDEAVSVGVLSERTVDRRGRIIERRYRRDLQLLSIRVVARLDDLPVVSSERLPDGRVRERVEVEGSALEVLRDPVGRFVSARAAPGPEDEDDGDDG